MIEDDTSGANTMGQENSRPQNTQRPQIGAHEVSQLRRSRVFILAKPGIYVDGIHHVVSRNDGLEVVACVKPGDLCWKQFAALHPDILLVHNQAVQSPFSEFFARFKQEVAALHVLVFGAHIEDGLMLNMVHAGARGYVSEEMTGDDLLEAIHEVCEGRLGLERRVLATLAQNAIEMERSIEDMVKAKVALLGDTLGKREAVVLELILGGLSTREIAERIYVSEQSVKLYLGRLFKKFAVTNRSQLILVTFQRVCPLSNMIRLIRSALDKRRIAAGRPPIIPDPLSDHTADSQCPGIDP